MAMAKYAGRPIGRMAFDWPLYFHQQIFRIRQRPLAGQKIANQCHQMSVVQETARRKVAMPTVYKGICCEFGECLRGHMFEKPFSTTEAYIVLVGSSTLIGQIQRVEYKSPPNIAAMVKAHFQALRSAAMDNVCTRTDSSILASDGMSP